jgi:alkylation response protein AidB-like acyl-CoA dehydrogenase
MDLSTPIEYDHFREEVRSFLQENLTDDLREEGRLATNVFPNPERSIGWQKICHQHGWAAPNWPQEYGGTGWDLIQRTIYSEESLKANAPGVMPMGLLLCGPCLMGYGTDAQKSYYLPRILSGEDFWCQGYSEPGAGSDLASLKTSATRDADDYIVNGAKIWTSFAQHANRIFCLVRTSSDGPPQRGITFLLIDMDTPGVRVEPIVGLDLVNEQNMVFFDDVRVPQANRIGRENDGWSVAKYLLEFERGGTAFAPHLYHHLELIKRAAAEELTASGERLADDRIFRRKFAALEIELQALEFTEHRMRAALGRGEPPGPYASLIKIRGTEITQSITELHIETVGQHCLPLQPAALVPGNACEAIGPEYAVTAMPRYLNGRAASIYAGSNEIQRGIIAKSVLGL